MLISTTDQPRLRLIQILRQEFAEKVDEKVLRAGANGAGLSRVEKACFFLYHPLPVCLQKKESTLGIWWRITGLDVVQMLLWMSFKSPGISKRQVCCQDGRPWEKGGWTICFSESCFACFFLKKECFDNSACEASPHLNPSSQRLYLSLLQVVTVSKWHTITSDLDEDIVSDVIQDVIPHRNETPNSWSAEWGLWRCSSVCWFEPLKNSASIFNSRVFGSMIQVGLNLIGIRKIYSM